jgi:hypothetical protein
MVTVTMADSTYERLKAKAATRRLSVDAYMNELAQQSGPGPGDSDRQLAALESFIAGMTAWTSSHLPPGHVTDDSRGTIYEGRGG